MQTIRNDSDNSSADGRAAQERPRSGDLALLFAGAATALVAVGAILAFGDLDSPLRGPLTLALLLGAPSGAIAIALNGLQPWGRVVASLMGGAALNLLVAQAMLAMHMWSVRGGMIAVCGLSLAIWALALLTRRHPVHLRRTTKSSEK
ncbi:hypothetical protein H9Y04_22705 [Streptomyces sp. TRM66268-LWL]|uniref:Integral membrane protein n=1 Tax=Streptomyces polyasparticus TaxID=2767826 RepID=A0ABR7SM01_9ACTN|nr:hypothetical protein [Streptomyces polyasparticus]MBC9715363.1 hypothetical protein [Streptomyces polyasparticus]